MRKTQSVQPAPQGTVDLFRLPKRASFEAQDLEELTPFLASLPATIVVDHMGRPDVAKGVDHPDFQRFVRLMDEHENIWVKVTCPERLTVAVDDEGTITPPTIWPGPLTVT